MSKNRNKKSPMFVSNINSNYEFVDYTAPEQPAVSAFSKPGPSQPGPSPSQPLQEGTSPKKAHSSPFDAITQPLESAQGFSPQPPKDFQVEPQQISRQQVRSNYAPLPNYPNQPMGNPNQMSPQKPMSSGPGFNPNYQDSRSFQPQQQSNQPRQPPQPQQPQQPQYQQQQVNNFRPPAVSSPQGQPPRTFEFNNQSQSNGFSSSFSSGFGAEKSQFESSSYSSKFSATTTPSSSSAGGFTDESIINCLPEPARSNILAIIRRSKNQG